MCLVVHHLHQEWGWWWWVLLAKLSGTRCLLDRWDSYKVLSYGHCILLKVEGEGVNISSTTMATASAKFG